MKAWIRQLALALSLAMLVAVCGAAEEIEIDGPEAGEVASEDPIDLEGIDLDALQLELDSGVPGVGDVDPGIGLPDLEWTDGEAYEAAEGAQQDNDAASAWARLQQRIYEAGYGEVITLDSDAVAGPGEGYLQVPSDKRITLVLNGWYLDRAMTQVSDNGIVLAVWGDLEICGPGFITGGWTSNGGGGIFVGDGGSVVLNNTTVSGNKADHGGGVWVSPGGRFTMNSGTITQNTAESGGGVCVSGCSGYDAFTMQGGEISDNSATRGGGLMTVDSGLALEGGSVFRNEADFGGGAFLAGSSYCRLKGGRVEYNKAANYGGGVCLDGGDNPPQLEIGLGVILSNDAKLGGGVCAFGGTVWMDGGSISGNRSTDAGGVFLQNARMELSKGSLFENTANNQGGGAVVDKGGTLVMQGGGISNNDASTGGGVMVAKDGTLELKTEMLSFNTADTAGGVAVGPGGAFVMSGGSVWGNKARFGDGGGVYSWQGAVVRMSGGSIGTNEVPYGKAGGGGVFPGTLYVSGTPSISGNYSGNSDSDCALGYLENDGHRIHVTGPLYSGARIGVNYPWTGPGVYPVTVGLGSNGYLGAFFSNSYDYPVAWNYSHREAEMRLRNTDPKPPAGPDPTVTPTTKVKLSQCKVGAVKDKVYTGKAIRPTLTIKYGGKTLKQETDYTVAYSGNKAVGTAKITLTGKGNYTGSRSVSFQILPRSTSISKLVAGKGSATVSWSKRSEGGGYQLQYSLKSSFSGANSVTLKKTGTTRTTVKGLASGRRYYFRVRAFKAVNGRTCYGAWSKAKSVVAK